MVKGEKHAALKEGGLPQYASLSTTSDSTPRQRRTVGTSESVPSTDSEGEPALAPETALIQSSKFDLVVFLKELYISYKWYLSHYPVYTKAITSSTIAMLGEVMGSWVRARRAGTAINIEPRRVAMFGTFGLCCTGPFLHFWYVLMEYVLGVKMQLSGKSKTFAKLFLDRCFWGPPYTFFTVCFLTYFQCFSAEKTWKEVRNKYVAILIMSQKVWVPGQWVNFEVVPQEFQVLFVNLVNVGWNTYLSLAN